MTSRPTLVWGVRPAVAVVLILLALLGAAWSVVTPDREDAIVGGAAAVVLALAALAAFRLRHRLLADPAGLEVHGLLSARRIPWSSVVSLAAPGRRRRGLVSVSLEIEYDDDLLIVLSRTELGTSPQDVLDELNALRRS
ncbi:PH domain-containing protein [Nakamurella alba]|uniref:PH domain-containing protein n=1 Tax=Nakamurella alba TaxID=2665158 RepID=UPI0018A9AD59|nr:PH domain-containing protein [Nakamurella alba]